LGHSGKGGGKGKTQPFPFIAPRGGERREGEGSSVYLRLVLEKKKKRRKTGSMKKENKLGRKREKAGPCLGREKKGRKKK